ncbi:MAG: hypothetical protein ACREB3_09780 [Burkholderiales bacterium]
MTLAFAILVLLMLWVSFDLSRASAWIPRIVLSFTFIVLLLQSSVELWGPQLAPREGELANESGRTARAFAAMAWISLLLLAAWLLGVALGSALFCAAWLRWHAGERWLLSLVMATAVAGVLWLLFSALPGAGLYPGVLWPQFQ